MKTYKVTKNDNGTICWYNEEGQHHREDGPAIEWANGDKEWRLNGELHREDGPAIEGAKGYKAWYIRGQRHREDRPAIVHADGSKEWWVNGKRLTKQEFIARTQPVKELTVAQIEQMLGHKVKIISKY